MTRKVHPETEAENHEQGKDIPWTDRRRGELKKPHPLQNVWDQVQKIITSGRIAVITYEEPRKDRNEDAYRDIIALRYLARKGGIEIDTARFQEEDGTISLAIRTYGPKKREQALITE